MADLDTIDLRTREGREAKALAEALAKVKVEEDAKALAESKPATFVLKKNHGMIHDGKQNHFYSAGQIFHAGKDDVIIHRLVQSGAALERE